MSWEKVKIKEIWKGFYDGPHATPPVSDCGGIFLGISNITPNGHIDLSDIKYISEQDLSKWTKRVVPQGGDIVFSYEATLNLYAIIPENFYGCLGRRMALIRVDENKISNKFLYYYFFSDEWRATIAENTIVGATVDRIPIAKFPEFPISLPPLKEQKRIADILSAYDDLIENNQKQIKLLEEAAQRLYKQWFIDLRYPGHETTKIVDGLPEGWKKEKLVEIIDYEIGGGWGEDNIKEKCDQPAFVIRGTDFYGITHGEILNIPFRYHSKTNLDARALCDGDIIFEVSGGSKTEGVAKTVLIKQTLLDRLKHPVMCASFCKLIRLKNRKLSQYMYDAFFYLRKSGKTAEYDKRSASSIVNYRWKDFLNEVDILIPPNNIVEMYNGIASSAYERIINFSLSIETAKKTRDRLLPKLMNGEL